MNSRTAFVASAVELVLVLGLLSKHASLFSLQVPLVLLLCSPVLALAHWKVLAHERIDVSQRLSLFFLTAPTAALSLSLILAITHDLKAVALLGGHTKEMSQVAIKDRVPKECLQQWAKDNVRRMKSERLIYAMLLASTCLLYWSRWSTAKRDLATSIDRSTESRKQAGKIPPT